MEFLKIWEILLRRKWIILGVFFVVMTTVVIGTHLVRPVYQAKAFVLVKKSDSLTSLLSSLGLQAGGGATSTSSSSSSGNTYYTDIALAKTRPLLEELIISLNLKRTDEKPLKPEALVKGYLLKTTIRPQPFVEVDQYEDTDMLELVAYSINPVEATNMANKLAELYIKDRVQMTGGEYKSVREFLGNQVSKVKKEYLKSLVDLKDFRIKEKTVSLDLDIQNIANKFSNMQAEQLKNLKGRLNELQISISKKGIDFTKEHPEYKQLEKDLEITEKLIQNEAKPILNREQALRDPLYDEFSKELQKVSEKSFQYSKLDLILSVNKDMYKSLLQYMTQVEVAESITLSNIRVVEHATNPDKPYFPRKPLNYAIGFSLAIFWGLAIGLFIEYIDTTIKLPEDIKIKSFAILGMIPFSRELKNNSLISMIDPLSPVVEAFRTVRIGIGQISTDKHVKTLLISSSIEGEGKSCLAANMALNFCMENKRVILVDLNLRRPALHRIFGIPNNKGITNVLAEGMSLEKAIISSNIKGFDLLLSGPVAPDSSRLIESLKTKNLIHKLKEMYDMVIIDTPPLMIVSDAIIIGQSVDGIIHIIEYGRTTNEMVEHAYGLMTRSGLNIIGGILNKFRVHGYHYYSYYYYK
ncbi:MAG: polysaccharide biosynthesis tyrosine autokinase [Ignavibacteriae bacterium]|nr:polysaccharide biosynthesis tyrosine autokinase [Ignavibacteriota bacterium]